MAPPKSTEPRLIVQNIIGTALQLLQYGRLMMILFALGIVVALAFYVYGRPIYFSRSLMRVTMLALPVNSESGVDEAKASSYRSLLQRLQSGTLALRCVQKMGLIKQGAAPEDVTSNVIPVLRIDMVDGDTVQVSVWSYFPDVVRDFAKVLATEFELQERESRDEFRQKALPAYVKESEDIKEMWRKAQKERLNYEQDHQLAELYIKQHSLEQVPKEIVLTQDQLYQMDQVRKYFADHESDDLDPAAKLALLSNFKLDAPVDVATVSRNANGTITEAQSEGARKVVDLVLKDNMVTPITPWQALDKQRRDLKDDLIQKGKIFGPNHEIIKKLNTDLAAAEDKLKAELPIVQAKFDLDYTRLQAKLRDFKLKIPEYNEVTEKFEAARQDYKMSADGQLEWDKAHSALATTIKKLQYGESRDRFHIQFLGVELLRDKDPISPNKSKLAMLALALGLGLACGAPMAIKFLDSTASRVEEIERVTGLTGIGVVPNTNPNDLDAIFRSDAIDSTVPNHLLEAFRIIRSQVLIRPNNLDKNQVIMVTSARPSEGKSTQAANLAWAFYSMGERTLLVDCDLRRGRIAKITGVKNAPGLTNLLIDKCDQDKAICGTQSHLLDVLPRGPVIAGTTEILCQEKFHSLVAKWRTEYDRIIIDSPPVLGLSETASLQEIADGVVLVIRSEVTRLVDVTATVDQLRRSGAHFFGFVLNAVDLSKLTNYYYYYYYSPDYYGDFLPEDQESTTA